MELFALSLYDRLTNEQKNEIRRLAVSAGLSFNANCWNCYSDAIIQLRMKDKTKENLTSAQELEENVQVEKIEPVGNVIIGSVSEDKEDFKDATVLDDGTICEHILKDGVDIVFCGYRVNELTLTSVIARRMCELGLTHFFKFIPDSDEVKDNK